MKFRETFRRAQTEQMVWHFEHLSFLEPVRMVRPNKWRSHVIIYNDDIFFNQGLVPESTRKT